MAFCDEEGCFLDDNHRGPHAYPGDPPPKSRLAPLFSSAKEDWATPQDLFNRLDDHYHFTLDVCASLENAKCDKYFTKEQDGLKQSWAGETCWMNCPYGRGVTGKWIRKAFMEFATNGTTVVALLPARTDTAAWHDYILNRPLVKVEFVRGRLKFSNAKSSAPFPSAIVVFGAK